MEAARMARDAGVEGALRAEQHWLPQGTMQVGPPVHPLVCLSPSSLSYSASMHVPLNSSQGVQALQKLVAVLLLHARYAELGMIRLFVCVGAHIVLSCCNQT